MKAELKNRKPKAGLLLIASPRFKNLYGPKRGTYGERKAEAVKGIYYICNAIPTICYALILIGIGLIFNLDKKKTDRMYAEMAAKREAK